MDKSTDTSSLENVSDAYRWIATKKLSYSWPEFMLRMWWILVPFWSVSFIGVFMIDATYTDLGTDVENFFAGVFFISLFLPIIIAELFGWSAVKEFKRNQARFLEDNEFKKNEEFGFSFTLDDGTKAIFERRYAMEEVVGFSNRSVFSMISMPLRGRAPDIALDAHKNDKILGSMPAYFMSDQIVRLEGDFNEYFNLYVPRKSKIDALSIITPDVMQVLIADGYAFDLIIFGGGANSELVLSSPGFIGYQPDNLEAFIKAAQSIHKEVSHKMRTLRVSGKSKDLLLEISEAAAVVSVGKHRLPLVKTILICWVVLGLITGWLYLFTDNTYGELIGFIYLWVSFMWFIVWWEFTKNKN